MLVRKIEEPSWARSRSSRRRRGVGKVCLRIMGAVVGVGEDDWEGESAFMAGDILGRWCWKYVGVFGVVAVMDGGGGFIEWRVACVAVVHCQMRK